MQEIHLEGRQRIKSQEMAFTGLFAALIAAGAYMRIDIPVQPFPMHFTLQFFFVLLAGYVLGARRGAACVCVYLAVGLAGIPVFAAGGGPAYLIRPTFGFLLGFVAAAWIQESCAGSVRGEGWPGGFFLPFGA